MCDEHPMLHILCICAIFLFRLFSICVNPTSPKINDYVSF